ncbi:MAG TPA: methyltransferase [Pyrinomonadaceae bacterium]|jgi:SAM-dependent methyltransferase
MDFSYIGDELEIFRHAINWKDYYGRQIRPFFGKEVLEVGAGIGATTESLCNGEQSRWVCLEPDAKMSSEITAKIEKKELPECCEVISSTLADLDESEKFDSIIYIDVLEHIENDKAEVLAAARHLKENGFLIVLAPAHQFLFTPFDAAIGHFRRYNKKTLSALMPAELEREKLIYLDSIGAFASLGNKLALRRSMPTLQQILLWDRKLVPVSTFFDSIIGFRAGKSVLGIWRKNTNPKQT